MGKRSRGLLSLPIAGLLLVLPVTPMGPVADRHDAAVDRNQPPASVTQYPLGVRRRAFRELRQVLHDLHAVRGHTPGPPHGPAASGGSQPTGSGPTQGPAGPLLRAYRSAVAGAPASCHLPVSLLAAIGQVESGNLAGRRIDHRHRAVPPVLGPVLDGAGFAAIRDTDQGRWDGDPVWDRAVGPMQFIPGTWQRFGVDGDSDGVADPQDIEDAAASAAKYLCFGGRDLSTPVGVRSAVLSYNHSGSYLALVLRWMNTFEDHGFHSVVSTVTTTSPSPSSHGGPVVIRHHGTLNAHAGRPRKHKPKHARHPARHPRPPSGTPTDIPTTQPPPAPSPDPGPTTGPTTGPEPSPGPTPSSSCTPDPTPDSSPSASPSDTPTASPAPTADPTATPSADPTASPTVDPTTADPCATATTSPETGARGTAAAAHRAAGGSSSGRKPTRLSNDQPPVRTRERGRSRQRSRRSAE